MHPDQPISEPTPLADCLPLALAALIEAEQRQLSTAVDNTTSDTDQ